MHSPLSKRAFTPFSWLLFLPPTLLAASGDEFSIDFLEDLPPVVTVTG
ncbi:MAG: hypothetical protein HQL48_11175, partial [Gammaproteobacteria bacterium]|nr:hypothetical protein [Gammaproteobacteria bacterium]